jgi:adenosylmethionine-8-amino-7-oxononanoate aminotransferase
MILAFDIKPSAINNASEFSRKMFAKSLDEGVLIRPIGNTVYVMPPYILSPEETMGMGESIRRALDKALA